MDIEEKVFFFKNPLKKTPIFTEIVIVKKYTVYVKTVFYLVLPSIASS